MLLGHGDDWYNFAIPMKANFSSNVWYGSSHAELHTHLTSKLTDTISYPHPRAGKLPQLLAAKHRCLPENIVVTNGAIEAIYLVAQQLQQSKTAIAIPSFSEYEDACRIFSHWCTFFTVDQLESIAKQEFSTIWLCNPNNPSGSLIEAQTLVALIKKYPDTHWIIDEVYQDFLLERQSILPFLTDFENVFIIQSLTKRFSIPGLRLGYVISSSRNVDALYSIKQPWSVNSLAIEAAQFLCENESKYPLDVSQWIQNTALLQQQLSAIDGIVVKTSKTPFFLAHLQKLSAADVKARLAQEYQLLIRDASTFRGLDKQHIRICTQTQTLNALLVDAMQRILSS